MGWLRKALGFLRRALNKAHDAGLIASQKPTIQTLGDPKDLAGGGR